MKEAPRVCSEVFELAKANISVNIYIQLLYLLLPDTIVYHATALGQRRTIRLNEIGGDQSTIQVYCEGAPSAFQAKSQLPEDCLELLRRDAAQRVNSNIQKAFFNFYFVITFGLFILSTVHSVQSMALLPSMSILFQIMSISSYSSRRLILICTEFTISSRSSSLEILPLPFLSKRLKVHISS